MKVWIKKTLMIYAVIAAAWMAIHFYFGIQDSGFAIIVALIAIIVIIFKKMEGTKPPPPDPEEEERMRK